MAVETEPAAAVSGSIAGEMEVEAYRRLFPLAFLERHLSESVRPDARRLAEARPITVALGAVSSAHGSALMRLGDTAMLASIKLEVMSSPAESPDEGSVSVEFHMPPICSPLVRPGRPADAAPVISKALEDVLMSLLGVRRGECNCRSDLGRERSGYELKPDKELPSSPRRLGLPATMTEFRDVKFEGTLFDQWEGFMVSISVEIPLVSVGDDGRVFTVGGNEGKTKFESVNREKRKLTLGDIPFSLTCALHQDRVLADPTSEEESIIESSVTVVIDSSDHLVSVQKLGGAGVSMGTIKVTLCLVRHHIPEAQAVHDNSRGRHQRRRETVIF